MSILISENNHHDVTKKRSINHRKPLFPTMDISWKEMRYEHSISRRTTLKTRPNSANSANQPIRPVTAIMNTRPPTTRSSNSRPTIITKKRDPTIEKWKEFGSALYDKVSLNDAARKREQTIISKQNEKLRERIKRGKFIQSLYSRDTMAKLESERQKYVRNISKASRRRLHTASTGTRNTNIHNMSSYSLLSKDEKSSSLQRPQTAPVPSSKQWVHLEKASITIADGSPLTSQTARTIRKEKLFHCGKPLPSNGMFNIVMKAQ